LTYCSPTLVQDDVRAGDLLNGQQHERFPRCFRAGSGVNSIAVWPIFDIRQVLHFSGGYQVPFGKDKRFLNQGKAETSCLEVELELDRYTPGGQPANIGLSTDSRRIGLQCCEVAGQSQKLWAAQGLERRSELVWEPGRLLATLRGGNRVRDAWLRPVPEFWAITWQTVTLDSIAWTLGVQAIQMNDRISLQFRRFFNVSTIRTSTLRIRRHGSCPSRFDQLHQQHLRRIGSTRDNRTIRGRFSLL